MMTERNSGRQRTRSSRPGSSAKPRARTGKPAGSSPSKGRSETGRKVSSRSSTSEKSYDRTKNPRGRSVFSSTRSRVNEPGRRSDQEGIRLQVVLAAAGFGSRRQCEELIEMGRVDVDGKIVNELGSRVIPETQKIKVDGELLRRSKPSYVVLNKPKGILCTNRDPQGRARAVDLVPPSFGRLFPVGRLDRNSEGLLLLTNDGVLAQRLTHPRYEVPKRYKVLVAGLVEVDLIQQLKKGIHLAEGVVQADEVILKSRYKQSSVLEIVLREGKNREIRRMLARIGHKVLQLQRTAIGPIRLAKMAPGEYRPLSKEEVRNLFRAARMEMS